MSLPKDLPTLSQHLLTLFNESVEASTQFRIIHVWHLIVASGSSFATEKYVEQEHLADDGDVSSKVRLIKQAGATLSSRRFGQVAYDSDRASSIQPPSLSAETCARG